MTGWADILDVEDFSFGYGVQSDLNTIASSWSWLHTTMPQVQKIVGLVDSKKSRRARGAATRPSIGKVWYKLAFRMRMNGQATGYAYTSGTPDLVGGWAFLAALGGESLITYAAANLTTVTNAKTFSLATQAKLGSLLASVTAGGVVSSQSWVKSITGAGPYIHNLVEDVATLPVSGEARAPTRTLFPGTTQPSAYTFRLVGKVAGQDIRFLGAKLDDVQLSFDEDACLWGDFNFTCYAGRLESNAGGIQPIDSFLTLEPKLMRGGARIVLGSNVFSTLADGSADPAGSCAVRDVMIRMAWPHFVVDGPTRREGVEDVILRSPDISVSFAVPKLPDYDVSAENIFEAAIRNETDIAFSLHLGDTPGKLFAFNLPAGQVADWPEWTAVDGVLHQQVTLTPGFWSGDGASTDAGNKVVRVALG